MKKFISKDNIIDLVYMTIGIMLVAISFSFFLDPANLVIGGSTGLATIFKELFNFDTAITVLVVNVILLVFGLILLGKEFFIKTLYGTLVLPLFIAIFNELYKLLITDSQNLLVENRLLLIIFSALIMGAGIGIVMKKGGTTGGTEIPQKIVYKYFHIPYSISLYLFDGVIVLIGSILLNNSGVIDLEMILYAIIFIYISGVVIDQIVFSGFNSRAIHIISEHADEIKDRILKDFERGVTEVDVIGGYTNKDKKMLICVLSSNEYYHLKAIIHEIDPLAFFYLVRASEVSGEGFTRK